MAPNRKKKKPAANPARGFATTSLPSKAKLESVEQQRANGDDDDTTAQEREDGSLTTTTTSGVAAKVQAQGQGHGADAGNRDGDSNDKSSQIQTTSTSTSTIKDMTPEELEAHLETSELDALVEKYAARSIADAGRQVSKLETERRQLRSQAYRLSTYPWLADDTVNELLEMELKVSASESLSASASAASSGQGKSGAPAAAVVDEEKLLIDIWTLERVLDALNLPRVPEAISHVAALATRGKLAISSGNDSLPGLQEAFEWYASNTGPGELASYEAAATATATATGPKPASTDGQSGDTTPLQANSAPASTIQSRQSPSSTPAQVSKPEAEAEVEVEVEEESESSPDISSDSDGGSDEDDDPAQLSGKYVHLQSLMWEAEAQRNEEENEEANPNPKSAKGEKSRAKRQKQMAKLGQKIDRLRRDPLFDEYEAEAAWRISQIDLQARHQQLLREKAAKRRREQSQNETHETTHKPNKNQESERPRTRTSQQDKEEQPGDGDGDGDGDGLLTGIFEGGADQESTTSTEQKVKLVNFGRWTGISPRRLLDEICKGHDPRSRVAVRILHNSSYSARHGLDIHWNVDTMPGLHTTAALPAEVSARIGPRLWSLDMASMAAASSGHSEAYVCTLGLFLVASVGAKEQKATARLSTVWRDVLRDLSEAKQRLANEEHRTSLGRIRDLIRATQQRLGHGQRGQVARSAETDRARPLVDRRRLPRPKPARLDAAQISREWEMRSARPAFREMVQVRRQLPVNQFKDMILACVADNAVSVICAETGAGKSSGIPVLLLEQEFSQGRDCRILVTQPRRISAVTLARRVSQELGESRSDLGTSRSLVGYAIRLEAKTSSATRITYATTGVLLRMLEESPDLDELDYLILDEVHERTMDLDLLFIALKRLQQRRSSLKIVLMSATVDARKFASYFGGAPVLDLPGRTFPVEVGFLEDAVEATKDLKDKAWSMQQDDGQDPVGVVVDDFNAGSEKGRPVVDHPEAYSSQTLRSLSSMDEYRIDYNLIVKLAASIASQPKYAKYSSAILIFMPGIGEMRRLHNLLLSLDTFSRNWVVYLLHSTFSTDDLERAFERPPPGYRKIVIATNIAETGITIPDVTAVIDTCKEKVMRFDERRQLSRLIEGFISRSSARQRRGRAARVQEGLCFHLVTKHRFDKSMLEQQVPEMLRLGLQDPILRIKMWDLGSIEETLSAAIDPPSRKNVLRAIEKLKDAGALTKTEALTHLGQQIARLPLEVTLAKLAIFGVIFRCLDPVLAMISLLTSKSPFLTAAAGSQADSRQTFSRGDSDLLSSLNAYESWRRAKTAGSAQEFCRKNHISDQAMSQVEEQKIQLLVYLVDAGLAVLSGEEKATLNRARTGGAGGRGGGGGGGGGGGVFYAIPARYSQPNVSDRALNSIVAMALYPRILLREGKGWRNVYTNQQVSPTARSVNHASTTPRPPRWLSFYEAMQNRSGNLNVFETSSVPESALALLLGDGEFKFFAGVLVLDLGKVKLAVKHWRQLMAIKVLRERVQQVLDTCYHRPGEELREDDWKWVDFWLRMEAAAQE